MHLKISERFIGSYFVSGNWRERRGGLGQGGGTGGDREWRNGGSEMTGIANKVIQESRQVTE